VFVDSIETVFQDHLHFQHVSASQIL